MKDPDLKGKPFSLDSEAIQWVKNTLNSLTVKEKIGQLLTLNCLSSEPAYLKTLLSYKPGGINRSLNLGEEDLMPILEYSASHTTVPLLYSGDLEHGMLSICKDNLNFHSPLGVAATENSAFAESMGEVTAKIGKSLGINWTFTPDVDIIHNFRNSATGTRTFGDNPETVLNMAEAYLRGIEQDDMACTLKHWPGDGLDDRDQHMVTTKNSLSMDQWRNSFGRVYRRLIEGGVKVVMSGHITLPAYDRELEPEIPVEEILPASLNPRLNNNLLRQELGFNGLIVSDSTYMAGFNTQGPRQKIIPQMIQSGCDMVLFSTNTHADLSFIQGALQQGSLNRERLDEAVMRVLALKASLNLHQKNAREIIMSATSMTPEETHEIGDRIDNCIKNSITLVKETQKILPLDPLLQNRVLLIQTPEIPAFANYEGNFTEILESRGFDVTEYSRFTDIDTDLYDVILYLVNQFEYFGKGSRTIPWSQIHQGAAAGLRRYWNVIPSIMISLNNPFHLYEVPRVKTYINAYSSNVKSLENVADMLVGKLPFKGKNPIDPFCGLEEARL